MTCTGPGCQELAAADERSVRGPRAALALVPGEWLAGEPGFDAPDDVRAAFLAWFDARMQTPHVWLPQVAR